MTVEHANVELALHVPIQKKLVPLELACAERLRRVWVCQPEPFVMLLITYANALQLYLLAQVEKNVRVELVLVSQSKIW